MLSKQQSIVLILVIYFFSHCFVVFLPCWLVDVKFLLNEKQFIKTGTAIKSHISVQCIVLTYYYKYALLNDLHPFTRVANTSG